MTSAPRRLINRDKKDLLELRRIDADEIGFAAIVAPHVVRIAARTEVHNIATKDRRLHLHSVKPILVLVDEINARVGREEGCVHAFPLA